jgi:PBSX family phage portal protein
MESVNAAVQQSVKRSNRRTMRAVVLPVEKATPPAPGQSKAVVEDPFEALTEAGHALPPPFDLLSLAMMPEQNTELGPCVEAMEVNIEGYGHRFVPRFKANAPEDVVEAARLERVRLENFFAYVSMEDSFVATRRKLRQDLETTGNAYLEVIRNAAGDIQGLIHIPSYQMRLGQLDMEPRLVQTPILYMQPNGQVVSKRVEAWKRFRRYIQSRTSSYNGMGSYVMRWFKSYGDNRVLNNETGEWADGAVAAALPEAQRANEVIHFRLYSSRSPYGLPRYIGNLLSILGDRASEEINYTTFNNNNVPSMMLMVSNGQLTQGTIDRITEFVEAQIQGTHNWSKFLIIEAESLEEGEDGGQVKVEAKPLVSTQHRDALFQEYSRNNQDKIRRAFRLPPILVGRSDDYTRSTAETSRRLADEQVFAPERDEFDDFINRRLFAEMGILYHKFRSNSPNTTDNTELVKILGGAEKTGGMTPRIARMMLEDILGQELPEFPAEFGKQADMPFSLLMAEAVKNKADPTEPGQQVTALKTLELIEQLTEGKPIDDAEADATLAQYAARINQHFESRWRQEVQRSLSEGG